MLEKKFRDKKILITGHTGFKGAWLSLILLKLGAKIYGYGLEPNTKVNLFDILKLNSHFKSKIADIRNFDELNKSIQEFKPDLIIHMAAQALVRQSYKEPRETFEINTMGTVNLLEACRHTSSIQACINITTDKCYENKEWVYGYRENDPLGGYDPYSASKANSEIITSSYRNSFFHPKDYGSKHNLGLASARAGNVIGGGDWSEDRLIPDCIKALANGHKIIIRNPLATRPWQHVWDPLHGYLHLASKLLDNPQRYSEAWNFGPPENSTINVENLVQKIIQYWGSGSYKIDSSIQAHEALSLKLDLSKTQSILKYQAKYTIDDSIKMTVDWYKAFYNKFNMFEFSSKALTLSSICSSLEAPIS